jgi:flagellar motor switch protein FliM
MRAMFLEPNPMDVKCLPAKADLRNTAHSLMETNWTRAQLSSNHKLQGASGDVLRAGHELLGRELALSLSAFLRCTVAIAYSGGEELGFGERPSRETPFCAGSALIRPNDQPLLIELDHSVLFPLIGIALGAKPGSFAIPARKPTDIELQVVNILYRLILSEAYRAWEPLVKVKMETVTLEIDQAQARPFQAIDQTFSARFDLKIGDRVGQLSLVTRPDLFAQALAMDEPRRRETPEPRGPVEATLELLLPAKVALDVWLDGSHMCLQDLMQLREGQVITLDHPVERKANCTLNGTTGFTGQIVSTGSRRAFLVEEAATDRS